ncbi:Cytochrome C oxidase, cbb3-type, subunit III [Mucilaginibacter sp. OK268]|uniref:c-type cytochrome n=1 Tax=Mucilaginibacter sp. OK268 TaxID=1881048 RepID=UPI0008905526|nr:cytochrome c [Mucilaginibacter sp. OK268]SDP92897.1 Cytochrome C oxidase, cbb3-type, subunit III [Mucilaginibacter sp. OK268]
MKSSIFKNNNKVRQLLTPFITIALLGWYHATYAQNPPLTGRALFEKKCATCHGNDGTRGRWGAKNLQISKLDNNELLNTISKGRGIMPNWGKKLSAIQISSVIEYIKTLRK